MRRQADAHDCIHCTYLAADGASMELRSCYRLTRRFYKRPINSHSHCIATANGLESVFASVHLLQSCVSVIVQSWG
jgi:hypothetical protein